MAYICYLMLMLLFYLYYNSIIARKCLIFYFRFGKPKLYVQYFKTIQSYAMKKMIKLFNILYIALLLTEDMCNI